MGTQSMSFIAFGSHLLPSFKGLWWQWRSFSNSLADLPAFRVFCEACKGFLGVGPVWLSGARDTTPCCRRRAPRHAAATITLLPHSRLRHGYYIDGALRRCTRARLLLAVFVQNESRHNVHTHMILQSADDGCAPVQWM